MMNSENFFDSYRYETLIEQILKENGIEKDDNHYSRHYAEIKKKIEEGKKIYKNKDYFKELPILDKDFSSYVIISNTPFVEEEKREKFKEFMNKTISKTFTHAIREYIFPYSNKDKNEIGNSAFVLIKFDTYEDAKGAANAAHGFQLLKTHKVNAVTYIDYDRVLALENEFHYKYIPFLELGKWEENNLMEMILVKCKDKIFVGKIQYLKKDFTPLFTLPLARTVDVRWSPQGKYLIINEGNVK